MTTALVNADLVVSGHGTASSRERISQSFAQPSPGVVPVYTPPTALPPLSKAFHRSQYLLGVAIDNLVRKFGIDHILFITLTFASDIRSTRFAHRRLNSLFNKVRIRYPGGYLWVLQPQASGRIHYHVLVVVDFDVHDHTDLSAWQHRDFDDRHRQLAMSPALRSEAQWWTAKSRAFGFGINQTAPIYSNGEALRKYLTRQDWRNDQWPFIEERSIQFWRCSHNLRCGSVKFSWNTPRGRLYRERLRVWAMQQGCASIDQLPTVVGKKWGWDFHSALQRQAQLYAQDDCPPPPPHT